MDEHGLYYDQGPIFISVGDGKYSSVRSSFLLYSLMLMLSESVTILSRQDSDTPVSPGIEPRPFYFLSRVDFPVIGSSLYHLSGPSPL